MGTTSTFSVQFACLFGFFFCLSAVHLVFNPLKFHSFILSVPFLCSFNSEPFCVQFNENYNFRFVFSGLGKLPALWCRFLFPWRRETCLGKIVGLTDRICLGCLFGWFVCCSFSKNRGNLAIIQDCSCYTWLASSLQFSHLFTFSGASQNWFTK